MRDLLFWEKAMIWDVLTGRKKGRKRAEKDEFDPIIERIEGFAPRKYRSERSQFYYNYKMLSLYVEPLMRLLSGIAQSGGVDANREHVAKELFRNLKGFYDPKDRLTLTAARADSELMRRFGELFLFFYGMERPTSDEIRRWLLDMQ